LHRTTSYNVCYTKLLRQAQLQAKAAVLPRKPIVYIVEWLQPLFIVKGWAAEMVEIAGGAMPRESGKILDPTQLEPADIIVVALCGLDRDVAKKELQSKPLPEWWLKSPAVKNGHVFVVDGNQMFNRPTNRLLDALEWLVQLIPAPENITEISKTFPFERYVHVAPPEERSLQDEINAAHEAACAAKQARYDDPATGYGVFTAWYLAERQVCCGNRCRHCPFGHANVPIENLGDKVNNMTSSVFLKAPKPMAKGRLGYLKPSRGKAKEIIVVFWSGGKDSFLALHETIQSLNDDQEIVLLTTFNPDSNVVPVQNIPPRTIVEQASILNLPLYLVALPTGADYNSLVKNALKDLVISKMPKSGGKIGGLVFGDLHLSDVKDWRDTTFAEFQLHNPLWHRDMHKDLIPLLTQLCVTYRAQVAYSAVDQTLLHGLQVGDIYESRKLPSSVDPMGENGEFHTVVLFEK
ncbi:ATP-binding Cassette (ABC) Superfamily, partial [Thraustotheca clavata]